MGAWGAEASPPPFPSFQPTVILILILYGRAWARNLHTEENYSYARVHRNKAKHFDVPLHNASLWYNIERLLH